MDDRVTEPVQPGATPFLAKLAGALVLVGLAVLLALWGVQRYVANRLRPDPAVIAAASLDALRAQNRLSAFAARFVAVTTSRESAPGPSAARTLIMPGLVRYDVDLARLTRRDATWEPSTRTLSVRLPSVEIGAPEVDLSAIREYGSRGVLTAFTDAERRLDEANRRAGQAELVRQAREPAMIRLARDATRRAVERSFALPLRAAGLDATVRVRFADEAVPESERWDASRSLEEVLADRQ